MKSIPPTPTWWHDLVCWFSGHPISRKVDSDWLVYPKGENRGIAVFIGTLTICERGHEIYSGPAIPWFEGNREDFDAILKKHGLKNFTGRKEINDVPNQQRYSNEDYYPPL